VRAEGARDTRAHQLCGSRCALLHCTQQRRHHRPSREPQRAQQREQQRPAGLLRLGSPEEDPRSRQGWVRQVRVLSLGQALHGGCAGQRGVQLRGRPESLRSVCSQEVAQPSGEGLHHHLTTETQCSVL